MNLGLSVGTFRKATSLGGSYRNATFHYAATDLSHVLSFTLRDAELNTLAVGSLDWAEKSYEPQILQTLVQHGGSRGSLRNITSLQLQFKPEAAGHNDQLLSLLATLVDLGKLPLRCAIDDCPFLGTLQRLYLRHAMLERSGLQLESFLST